MRLPSGNQVAWCPPFSHSSGPTAQCISLPSSRIGIWSAGLLATSLVLIVLNSAVVMPWTEQTSGLDAAQRTFNFGVFVVLAAAGFTGVVAVISKHERSVVLFLSILLLVHALVMNAAESLG